MKIKHYFAAALVLLCLCGCGTTETGSTDTSSTEPVSQTEAVSAADAESSPAENTSASSLGDVYSQVASQVELPEMVDLNEKLLMRYYGLSADVVADFAGGVASGGVDQDEIVLIKAASEDNVLEIETALQTRYDSKLSQQENYNADEAEKIRNCKVETHGLYVTLIISNDANKITEIVNGAIGQ